MVTCLSLTQAQTHRLGERDVITNVNTLGGTPQGPQISVIETIGCIDYMTKTPNESFKHLAYTKIEHDKEKVKRDDTEMLMNNDHTKA